MSESRHITAEIRQMVDEVCRLLRRDANVYRERGDKWDELADQLAKTAVIELDPRAVLEAYRMIRPEIPESGRSSVPGEKVHSEKIENGLMLIEEKLDLNGVRKLLIEIAEMGG